MWKQRDLGFGVWIVPRCGSRAFFIRTELIAFKFTIIPRDEVRGCVGGGGGEGERNEGFDAQERSCRIVCETAENGGGERIKRNKGKEDEDTRWKGQSWDRWTYETQFAAASR